MQKLIISVTSMVISFTLTKHATREVADNSRVCVKATDDSQDGDDFYGWLEEIIELEYLTMPI